MTGQTPDSERTVWQISAIIEATDQQAEQAMDAIGLALCPDPDHDGYCPVPWTLLRVRFDDLDDEERASWQAQFDADRRRAADAGYT